MDMSAKFELPTHLHAGIWMEKTVAAGFFDAEQEVEIGGQRG